jgi:hypothetical protein
VREQPVAGYSGRPLAQKLGIRDEMRLVVLAAPRGYRSLLAPLPPGVVFVSRVAAADLVHWFVVRQRDLAARIGSMARALDDAAVLWISWPKRTSGRVTDLTGDVLREVVLAHGLVDVKVCAVDDTWSALKFVRRLRERRG